MGGDIYRGSLTVRCESCSWLPLEKNGGILIGWWPIIPPWWVNQIGYAIRAGSLLCLGEIIISFQFVPGMGDSAYLVAEPFADEALLYDHLLGLG